MCVCGVKSEADADDGMWCVVVRHAIGISVFMCHFRSPYDFIFAVFRAPNRVVATVERKYVSFFDFAFGRLLVWKW